MSRRSDRSLTDLPRRFHEQCRARRLATRTEKAYRGWIRRFLLFHGGRHPIDLGEVEVEAFLNDLAVRARVAATTQNQALAALLLYASGDSIPRERRPGV